MELQKIPIERIHKKFETVSKRFSEILKNVLKNRIGLATKIINDTATEQKKIVNRRIIG